MTTFKHMERFGFSDTQLAYFLGAHPSSLVRWRNTNRVPDSAYSRVVSLFAILSEKIEDDEECKKLGLLLQMKALQEGPMLGGIRKLLELIEEIGK